MFQAFLIKYGEIGVKGKNRHLFEDALMDRIRQALSDVEGEFEVTREQGRVYVEALTDFDYEDTLERLQCVFGIVGICPVVIKKDEGFGQLAKDVIDYIRERYQGRPMTFKINARRARKEYPMTSMEVNAALGEKVLEAFPQMKVDVHEPELMLNIEIRKNINLYSDVIPGPGGMPVGTSGRGTLLLSGGIDSPVAGYMVAKRGVMLEAVYFNAPPYTSDRATRKVVDLAGILARYAGPISLKIVNFTDIQLYIYEKCPHEELTIIMRRYMMRIAEHFARESGSLGLVTGESIGQVASQTMHSLAATDEVCGMPVYRPLIGFDKQEIIAQAEKIGTYETSILPYEDCCTIFVAKHPVTKPNLKAIRKSETRLEEKIGEMMKEAIETAETVCVGRDGLPTPE